MRQSLPEVDTFVDGIVDGSRAWIARAITLVESTRPDHRAHAQKLLTALAPRAGCARRVGITGVPGVGKSTFIDALGTFLTGTGHRVAVLAVDPSSTKTGGSILGDKTRMARLASDPATFIRPSPTAGTLGGVARATREAMVVVEAAGYDIVLVETVGVGQSEVTVAGMVDSFLFLALARAGDQLQGIKKGVLELADVIAVNKADGLHKTEAESAARELSAAMRLLRAPEGAWQPPVLTCSAQDGTGVEKVWKTLVRHQDTLMATGELTERRRTQHVDWMWSTVRDSLLDELRSNPRVAAVAAEAVTAVHDGLLTPSLAAERILTAFRAAPQASAGDGE